ncbi:membrane protein insertion efficiency factor YidD [Thalassospiraceae bacterium LMO-JJ14]|nr:membrane protein insertion efficiency factor YidD [Thalassospiraceae bacterium LMO-JJ14]
MPALPLPSEAPEMPERVAERLVRAPLHALVMLYRYGISPFMPGSCRFHPSCSCYAEEALHEHGAWRGSFLAVKRILRCHPWGGSGYDPVPAADPVDLADRKGSPEHP